MKLVLMLCLLSCSFAHAATAYIGMLPPAEGPRVPIASLTKMVTALVVISEDLDDEVMITLADFDTIKGTRSKLKPGLVISKHKLLELALIASDNRAAFALARTYSGGYSKFVLEMNAVAKRLLANAEFVDPAGLASANVASARAVALIGQEFAASTILAEFSIKAKTNFGNLAWASTNRYIRAGQLRPIAQKTGFTREAGSCLYMMLKDQRHLIILGVGDRYTEANRLLVSKNVK